MLINIGLIPTLTILILLLIASFLVNLIETHVEHGHLLSFNSRLHIEQSRFYLGILKFINSV